MMSINNPLKIVVDTNVLLVSILPRFSYYKIFEEIQSGKVNVYVSNDIVSEYTEVFSRRYTPHITEILLNTLFNLPNVFFVDPKFQWKLIELDPDDNKFVDCAVASSVDYIISNDRHFDILKEIPFPKVTVLKAEEFIALIKIVNK
ncbi:MAG: putative toxin-antitoxin system toxin component, PIN family [Saprospiraceae bacterium]|nr:putative toxin-antitoxin system toxin component, PIN family [Saprospiraceae bacterium]